MTLTSRTSVTSVGTVDPKYPPLLKKKQKKPNSLTVTLLISSDPDSKHINKQTNVLVICLQFSVI